MSRPSIISHEQVDKTQNGYQLGEFGLAGEHYGVIVHAPAYLERNVLFSRGANQENICTTVVDKPIRQGRITLSGPSLGSTIYRAGTNR